MCINVCNSGNEFVGEIFIFNFGIPKKKNVFNSQIFTIRDMFLRDLNLYNQYFLIIYSKQIIVHSTF